MSFFITWWLAATVLGVIALPLSFFTFRHLPDRGYATSRALGLLLVSYFAWLLSYRLNRLPAILAAVALLVAASAFFGRGLWASHRRFLNERRGYVLAVELLFIAVLAVATLYKTANGAILDTEKPADFTLLHGVMTAKNMPPHDPWLSEAPVSYYYFGYFIVGLVAEVTSTSPGVAFNMGLALIWALTAVTAFGLGYALTRRRRYGLLLAFALTLMGNLDYWFRAVHVYQYGDLNKKYLQWQGDPALQNGISGTFGYLFAPRHYNWDYYHASRIIDANARERLITEFPAFGFFLGDLHPHVIALPFFLVTIALSLSLLRAPLTGWGVFGARGGWQAVQFVVAGVVYGSLGFLNSWDFPTGMLVLAASLALRQMWISGGLSVRWFVSFATVAVPLAGLTVAAYLPFYRSLQTQLQGIEVVQDRTDLYYWPFLFGAFLLVLVPALVTRARTRAVETTPPPPVETGETRKKERARKPVRRTSGEARATGVPTAPSCVLCASPGTAGTICDKCGGEIVDPQPGATLPNAAVRSALARLGGWLTTGIVSWVLALLLVAIGIFDLFSAYDPAVTLFSALLALLAVVTLAVRSESREQTLAAVLAAYGFGILVVCEWVYFKDLFSMFPHLARMNTVFKFYGQAWVLLSVASTPLLAWLLRTAWPRWPKPARAVWAALAALVAIGSVWYPILTLDARLLRNPHPYKFLDGGIHFQTASPEDARAVEWLRARAAPDGKPPVVLEAWGTSFTPYGRIATYTGFTTVLGWEGHEEQWRGGKEKLIRGGVDAADTVSRRYIDIDRLYFSPDLVETQDLLRRYRVDYVYVGALERTRYAGATLTKWASLGERVYGDGSVEIFAVRP